jgi:hypothetical protein
MISLKNKLEFVEFMESKTFSESRVVIGMQQIKKPSQLFLRRFFYETEIALIEHDFLYRIFSTLIQGL